ncbi:acetyl-CoA C-acyltransferase [Sporosarcina sp. P12(2017)]|uniref:acetyl-CoA C-acyltransferase n=1 Tax=unclassified Sporosarcina TaxID=2647733 RepID=UPI000C16AB89|nr:MULTISPECIES: acetyl-CoA C-acyltransferase [unclassified Sporosarcina]PIC55977.1 acetyl-CoA C-acyltransferase [Sporosarcina sp. P10]PIC59587.1 acetyl-CoA C-acyltransferase [Sporosarcina sp. P12(2017)]
MSRVAIIDAVRTPIGRYAGALSTVRADDLGAMVIKALLERNPAVDPKTIDDVIFGNANGAGEENRNVARMSALLAGLPIEVSGTTLNRLCGSGLDAVNFGARAILAGEQDVIIAGGTESMSRAPYVMAKPERALPRGDMKLQDTTIGWRFVNSKMEKLYGVDTMPQTAENVAIDYGISRNRQDEFAYQSQMKTKKAQEQGVFNDEIIPVTFKTRKGEEITVDTDEHPRADSTMNALEKLRPLFPNGTITAGNASGVNDGAAAVLLMREDKAKELGLDILGYYKMSATAGVEPRVMGIGPIASTKKLLEKANVDVKDLDLIELNEAFASQSLACIDNLHLPIENVNVNGGAIALGHPLGASGTRILTTLLHQMKRQDSKLGLATMCIGVGQGISTLVERD